MDLHYLFFSILENFLSHNIITKIHHNICHIILYDMLSCFEENNKEVIIAASGIPTTIREADTSCRGLKLGHP